MAGLSGLTGPSGLSGIMGGGISYLLRDEFTTNRAAGTVDGTLAEPGPGTRNVVDTGNMLIISGDNLTGSATTTGNADPAFHLTPSIARAAGRIFKWDVGQKTTFGGSSVSIVFGCWGTVPIPNYSTPDFAVRNVGGNIQFFRNNNVVVTIDAGVFPEDTSTPVVFIARTTGCYLFVGGDLCWISNNNNSANLYPALASVTGGRKPPLSGYVRVPDVLWLPTPLAYDTFTRANGALGNSETTGPDAQTTTARAWNNRVGTTQVSGNAASASALAGGIAIATVDTGTTSVLCSSTLTRAGNEIGVVVRYADSNNYVRAYHDGTDAKLDKVVGGGVTNVISAVQAYAAGARIMVVCDGTTFKLYYNNVRIGATSTINDAALQTGTEQGTYSTNVGNTQDAFTVFARSDAQYLDLDAY